jgi:hypothetical protein
MVIPKGKKFEFRIRDLTAEKREGAPTLKRVPAIGYLGNAYLMQDINLSVSNNFTKPFEGILGMVPHTLDLAVQGATGTSINNARFTHMKYWAGSESTELSIQLLFETQVDSFYDVYYPVTELVTSALPEEVSGGFYKPPVPSVKYLAEEFANFARGGVNLVKTANSAIVESGEPSEELRGVQKRLAGKLDQLPTNLEALASSIENTGFETDLYIGDNFKFPRIMMKNISVNFSNELAYAPIHTLNGFIPPPGNTINPYAIGETATKALCNTFMTAVATANNTGTSVGEALRNLPTGAAGVADVDFDFIASFPIRAEVTIQFDLMYPLTRNDDGSPSSFRKVFQEEGSQFTGY